MSKTTLTNLVNLQNETTAVNAINQNNSTITTAFENTLSRDGTAPNQMAANIDMNNNRILNLPAPTSNYEPLRSIDATTLAAGNITVSSLPAGGTANQVLTKNSSTNYDVSWQNKGTATTSPTYTVLSSVGSGTYTLPVNCFWIEVEMVGAGGGGWGSGVGATAGAQGSSTAFGTFSCSGGSAGTTQTAGGLPGSVFAVAGQVSFSGQQGGTGNSAVSQAPGGDGGCSPFGGNGKGGVLGGGAGGNAVPNTGSGGGGGGGSSSTTNTGGGGGSGGYIRVIISSPASSYFYSVGTGGSGGLAGTNGAAGGSGGAGFIIVKEYYK